MFPNFLRSQVLSQLLSLLVYTRVLLGIRLRKIGPTIKSQNIMSIIVVIELEFYYQLSAVNPT